MSEAYDLYQEGRARLREGMAAQATVALERAKRLEPEKASIREALGIAYYRITRWEAAEAEFRKVIELSPVDAYAHFALGRSLAEAGARRGGKPLPEARQGARAPAGRAVRGRAGLASSRRG